MPSSSVTPIKADMEKENLNPNAGSRATPKEAQLLTSPRTPRKDNSAAVVTGFSRSKSSYRDTRNKTIFAKIERSLWFQNTTLLVIILNALWISVDVQWNHPNLKREDGSLPLEPTAIIIDNIFCVYFTVEVIVRFFSYVKVMDCLKDPWFDFDTILVILMVLETWLLPLIFLLKGGDSGSGLSSLSSLRLLRLLRLTRMARIMRFFPELMTLVRGMVRAMNAVFFILLFLVLVMYVFAIVFTSQLGSPGASEPLPGEEDEDATGIMLMATLGHSMMTLFTNGVLGDNLAQTCDAIQAESLALFWVFIVFCVISAITLLNMLIGVLCQVIDDTARSEAEGYQMSELREALRDAFEKVDTSNDGRICKEEWENIREQPAVRKCLLDLGVEENQMEERLNQMGETLYGAAVGEEDVEQAKAREEGITFEEFVTKMVELRWDTPACALDIKVLKSSFEKEDRAMQKRLDCIETNLARLLTTRNIKGGPLMHDFKAGSKGDKGNESSSLLANVPTELLMHMLQERETHGIR